MAQFIILNRIFWMYFINIWRYYSEIVCVIWAKYFSTIDHLILSGIFIFGYIIIQNIAFVWCVVIFLSVHTNRHSFRHNGSRERRLGFLHSFILYGYFQADGFSGPEVWSCWILYILVHYNTGKTMLGRYFMAINAIKNLRICWHKR